MLTRPKLVLLDEPSMGLAPIIVQEIFEIIEQLNLQRGTVFLIAEQNINVSLRHARRGYVIDSAWVALSGNASDFLVRGNLHGIFLGVSTVAGNGFS
jgi:branched-chain amino acid transport system ATP-binding protein